MQNVERLYGEAVNMEESGHPMSKRGILWN